MQFFYIDYMNGNKKERNIGFLRADKEGMHVGLRGVPSQCGSACSVYVINRIGEKRLLGRVPIRNGYGMEKLGWTREVSFRDCVEVEIPLYGTRVGRCVIREAESDKTGQEPLPQHVKASEGGGYAGQAQEELLEEPVLDKWSQLLHTYPQVHIFPEAQSILIKPRDIVILPEKYHDLAGNSFVLHAYYNYRQLLLFRYIQGQEGGGAYYIGVPGVYYERECRIAEMFGFEGFENGEARMREEQERENALHKGCFGYYMKQVEI